MKTKPFHCLLLPVLLLFCFGGVFYTYYKPIISNAQVSTEECLNIVRNTFIQTINQTSNLNIPLNQQPLVTKPAVMEENQEHHANDIIMLMWSWPFGVVFNGTACSSQFGIKGCQITDDRSQYDEAHGVMFHHRDISGELTNLHNMPRHPHQKWVWLNMESPSNAQKLPGLDGLFNLTSNYRRDSDVWVPVGKIVEIPEKDKTFEIPPKDKLVCWIVSNWNPNFERVKYFNELSKHIKIEAYGSAFNRRINKEDYIKTVTGCKFYLGFENSVHKDYFTEKVFKPLMFGTVPVVLGTSRENYEQFIPADSFIHVDDFKSPQELAEHLTFLDKNPKVYEQYFNWRRHFIATHSVFAIEQTCRSCEYIRNYKGYRVFKDLTKWYWG
ncbi:4-galactosyl-N-acetylglucosaminide 3-alpha-L-fucosyltransferase 9-like [Clarias gariepinus]|uniref:4-galactosyl-N-acetylglucosaminide 3-alpha-L-fucosyltransferase 9-like n=1 Tax=Clarias gariepinus TaxID=13013 RepID=UPI00234D4095|nr:4-galactosyl-N-acetylglucosaminide 3-alpha-L-fucosyltransferase 9-like [Clarias gariepinus]